MKDIINDELIDKLENLAAIEIGETERDGIKKDMDRMLKFVEKVSEYGKDISESGNKVEKDELRDDVVVASVYEDNIGLLDNAPQVENDCIVVPKTT